jgi:hypothetical protein
MATPVLIKDGLGTNQSASITKGTVEGDPNGLLAYCADYREYNGAAFALIDSDGNAEMAGDWSASGTPDNVYIDDPTTNWTNSTLSGTWDFASTAITPQGGTECIDGTSTVDGDQIQIERSSDLDMGSYEAVSGYIYLTKYNATRNSILLSLGNADTVQGNSVNIGDYIDTGSLNAWQQFTIPKADLGITDQDIDQFNITVGNTSGQPADFYLDTLNIEESGGQLFSATIPRGITFELYSINYMFHDNITQIEPNQIMGLSKLTNGITIRTEVGGRATFGAGARSFAELIAAGAQLDSTIIGATESCVNFVSLSPAFTRLKGDDNDRFSFFLSDDLSGLTSFRAILRGRILK